MTQRLTLSPLRRGSPPERSESQTSRYQLKFQVNKLRYAINRVELGPWTNKRFEDREWSRSSRESHMGQRWTSVFPGNSHGIRRISFQRDFD